MAPIVVAEDNPTLLTAIAIALRLEGHDVTTAPNGRSALELCDESVDLVMSDIWMPEMDGIELLIQIRTRRVPPIKMVAMSGGRVGSLVNDTFLAHAERLGAVGVLKKPFGLDLLSGAGSNDLGLPRSRVGPRTPVGGPPSERATCLPDWRWR